MEKWDEGFTEISYLDFERWVRDLLANLGQELKEINVQHNQEVEAHDGIYQIDVLATFSAFGADFKVIVECKHHKNPIKREVVQALHDKVRSIGAHKGMLFATTGFQRGAIEYAAAHGIALVKVCPGASCYFTRSFDLPVEPCIELPEFVGWLTSEVDGKISMACVSIDEPEYIIKAVF